MSVVLVLAFGSAVASGQDTSSGEVARYDIAVRDGLIASQEALLNAYRCRFEIDTPLVPRGCFGGRPLDLRGELAVLTINTMDELRGGEPPTLKMDEGLTAIAQAHAQAMADASDWL